MRHAMLDATCTCGDIKYVVHLIIHLHHPSAVKGHFLPLQLPRR